MSIPAPQEQPNPQTEAANFAYSFKNLQLGNEKKHKIVGKFTQKIHNSIKPEFVHSLVKEFDLDKLVHLEKDGETRYFQIDPGRYNLIQECENLSRGNPNDEFEKYSTFPTPAFFLFENIFFGLKNTQDIKVIMDSVLKAGNLPQLQKYWYKYGRSILQGGQNNPNYKTNSDWGINTFFPTENKPAQNKW